MSSQQQQKHQDQEEENIKLKPVQKIYNAFANILMKYESNNNSLSSLQNINTNNPQQAAKLQRKQNTNKINSIQNAELQPQNNNQNEVSASTMHQMMSNKKQTAVKTDTKKTQSQKTSKKTTNKRKPLNQQIFTIQQKRQLFESNPIKQFLTKEKQKQKKSLQIKSKLNYQVIQQSEVQEVNINHIVSNRFPNQKKKYQKVKPYIQIQEDKTMLALLDKKVKVVNKQKSNQIKQIKFQIVIKLQSNTDSTQIHQKNKIMTYTKSLKKSNQKYSLSKSCVNFNSKNQSSKNIMEQKQSQNKLKVLQSKLSKKKQTFLQSQITISKSPEKNNSNSLLKTQNKEKKIEANSFSLRKSAVQKQSKNNSHKVSLSKSTVNQKYKNKQPIKTTSQSYTTKKSPINLRNLGIKEIVDQLFTKKLIQQNLYLIFIKNHTSETMNDFQIKFQKGKLHKFNYKIIPFTTLDHRRLSEILIELFPFQYALAQCSQLFEINEFIQNTYALSDAEYKKLYTKIDNISKINWWSQLQSQKEHIKRQTEKRTKKNGDLICSKVNLSEMSKKSKNKANNNQLQTSLSRFQAISSKKRSKPFQDQQDIELNIQKGESEQQITQMQPNMRKKIKLN